MTLRLSTHSAGGLTQPRSRAGPPHRRPGRHAGWLTPPARRTACRALRPAPSSSAGRPHVIVDGAPRPGTALHLVALARHAHPAGAVARPLGRDRPAGPGATRRSAARRRRRGLGRPLRRRRRHRPRPCCASRAWPTSTARSSWRRPGSGDFDVVTDRRAALVAFALRRAVDVEPGRPSRPRSRPVTPPTARRGPHRGSGVLPALAEDPDRYRALWRARPPPTTPRCGPWPRVGHHRGAPRARPGRGPGRRRPPRRRPGGRGPAPRCTAPPCTATTACLRVATVAGGRVELRYRYESWVRLETRRPRPRVDLGALAAELTGPRRPAARWVFDGAGCHHRGAAPRRRGRRASLEPAVVARPWCATAARRARRRARRPGTPTA